MILTVGLNGTASSSWEEDIQMTKGRLKDGKIFVVRMVDGEKEYIKEYMRQVIGVLVQGYNKAYYIGGIE